MDLRFTLPELRKLDLVGTEILAGSLAADQRPPRGVGGLVDWRLVGRLSGLILSGFASGAVGEVLLIPPKPKLPFDKVLLFGIGRVDDFNELVFRAVVEKMLYVFEGLRARTAVVELPGRHVDRIEATRAADILLECADGREQHDVWTLVEPADAQRAITQHLTEERRRARPA
ncbi:MAG TPA: M17 family peptidase N-terminal domain-containing protein [Polyangiaceae bacterium]|jgi:hypothetical protein